MQILTKVFIQMVQSCSFIKWLAIQMPLDLKDTHNLGHILF